MFFTLRAFKTLVLGAETTCKLVLSMGDSSLCLPMKGLTSFT